MTSKRWTGVVGAIVISFSGTTFGQLVIDQSGARDVLSSSDMAYFATTNNRVRFSFDSQSKGVAAGYFLEPSNDFLGCDTLLGFRAKISAIDGYSEFFRFERLPGIQFSTIFNLTPNSPSPNGLPFFSILGSYTHEEYQMFDSSQPAAQQLSKPAFDGGSVTFSTGYLVGPPVLGGQFGVGFSVGYEHTSNYKDLAQVQVSTATELIPLSNGGTRAVSSTTTTAREGSLKRLNGLPLQLTLSYEIGIPTNWVGHIPLVPKGDDYYVVLGPYGLFEPTDGTEPVHRLGIRATLKSITSLVPGPQGDIPAAEIRKQKLAYPIAGFVEWGNTFTHRETVTAGVATIWTF